MDTDHLVRHEAGEDGDQLGHGEGDGQGGDEPGVGLLLLLLVVVVVGPGRDGGELLLPLLLQE